VATIRPERQDRNGSLHAARILPRAEAHKRAIEAGAGVLMNIDPAAFDHS
jgi:hypothetical protein